MHRRLFQHGERLSLPGIFGKSTGVLHITNQLIELYEFFKKKLNQNNKLIQNYVT